MSVQGAAAALGDGGGHQSAMEALEGALETEALSQAQFNACKEALDGLRAAIASAAEKATTFAASNEDARLSLNTEAISLERARLRREEMEAALEEAEVARSSAMAAHRELEVRDLGLQADMNDARQRQEDLTADVAQLKRSNEDMVQPALRELVDSITTSRAEAAHSISTLESLTDNKTDLRRKIDEVRAAGRTAEGVAVRLKFELARSGTEPARLAKQLDVVNTALAEARRNSEKISAALAARDSEMVAHGAALDEVQAVRVALDAKLGRHREDVEAREHDVQNLENALRAEKQQRRELLERRVELTVEEEAARTSARLAAAATDSAEAGYERTKRELKRVLERGNDARMASGPLDSSLSEKASDIAAFEGEMARAAVDEARVRRGMDASVEAILKEESEEKKTREALAELAAECGALDAERAAWAREEALGQRQLTAIATARELKARDLAKMGAARKAAIEASRSKELQLLDLTKQLADVQARFKTATGLYEAAKLERNSYSTANQRAKQSIAEMQERLKILSGEADILGGEADSKDKALVKEQMGHVATCSARDLLRNEVSKAVALYRLKQADVEATIQSIDKQSAIINGIERDMLASKRAYEAAVELRNYTGIQLIDRNDELCVLYEKSNIQEKTLDGGEVGLRAIAEESRGLKTTLTDQERYVRLARAKGPDMPVWAEKVLTMKQQLATVAAETAALAARLEQPSSGESWTPLGGDDPTLEELQQREMAITRQVDLTREALLARNMAREEADAVIATLKAEAVVGEAAGMESSATLARTVNELQAKLRDVTRRLMALVSELSLYQATALKLEEETAVGQAALDAAAAAAAAGLPPSAAALAKLSSLDRSRAVHVEGAPVPRGPPSRPTAYMPEGGNGPVPFHGTMGPFKPSEASGRFFAGQARA